MSGGQEMREAFKKLREKKTIEVWNICECGEVLHSIIEGTRGKCGGCWLKDMPKVTKAAMNRLIAAAFKPTTDDEKAKLVEEALDKLDRDNKEPTP